jgi:pimeloyl-ACP methyl ester carboxylesterase
MARPAVQRHPVPLQWQVNALRLTGLSWGTPGEKPLLALHGWLDNAASFAYLAPLLTGYHVVALDLTGHGQSARRSMDASYQIWDDLPEILGVLDALGWDTFDLMGHSRGAIIATLLASSFPERVRQLVLLDAVVPEPVAEEEFPRQMRRAMQDKLRLLHRANREFASIDDAAASAADRGLPAEAVRVLVERNLVPCEQGVTWSTDPRLRGASAVKLTQGQIRAVLQALGMPTLLLLSRGMSERAPRMLEYAQRYITGLTLHIADGGHHFHMEPRVDEVARYLQGFLAGIEQRESTC